MLQDPISITPFPTGPKPEKTSIITQSERYGTRIDFINPWSVGNVEKFDYVAWSSMLEHTLIHSRLDHSDFGTVDTDTSALYLNLTGSDAKAPGCPVTNEFSQDGEAILNIGGFETVRKGFAIKGAFSSSCGNRVKAVYVTTYKDLANGCQASGKRTCTPLPPNVCRYTNLHCAKNATGFLNCYDGMNTHFSSCSDTNRDENNRLYTKCDYPSDSPYGVPQYSCVIDIPSSSSFHAMHVLDNPACTTWTNNCPVNQTCATLYATMTPVSTDSGCVATGTTNYLD